MDTRANKLSSSPGSAADPARQTEPKRPYTPPRLIEYGSIAKLTQSVGTANGDGGQQMRSTGMGFGGASGMP